MPVVAHRAYAFDQHTISSTALLLSDTDLSDDDIAVADSVHITVENAAVRYRYDGAGNPTAAIGNIIPAGGEFVLIGNVNIKQLKLIRVSTDALVNITLLRL